jgi:CRP-like cAMP-binding protein
MPISGEIIERIKDIFDREEFPAKTLLVKEGTLAKKLFYIEKGCCRAWFNNDGKDVTYQFLFEGNFASSFETIISNDISWYSVETLEPTVMYSVGIEDFRKHMEQHLHIKAFYYQYVEKRLLFYQKLFVDHIKDSPEQRYRELLEQHPEIVLRVPQHYIASFLGITSVSLSRIRNRK